MGWKLSGAGASLAIVGSFLAVATGGTTVFHCDGLDGPVVKAAQVSLETGNLNHVLVWVARRDEAELGKAFEKTMAVRKSGPEARELADRYFFETVVRIHRAAEGASYTGLKPAGRDLGPAIPAADKAISDGTSDALARLLVATLERGLKERFHAVLEKRGYPKDDVPAGREYVHAYVEFVHYVERMYEAAGSGAAGHYPDTKEPKNHH